MTWARQKQRPTARTCPRPSCFRPGCPQPAMPTRARTAKGDEGIFDQFTDGQILFGTDRTLLDEAPAHTDRLQLGLVLCVLHCARGPCHDPVCSTSAPGTLPPGPPRRAARPWTGLGVHQNC